MDDGSINFGSGESIEIEILVVTENVANMRLNDGCDIEKFSDYI